MSTFWRTQHKLLPSLSTNLFFLLDILDRPYKMLYVKGLNPRPRQTARKFTRGPQLATTVHNDHRGRDQFNIHVRTSLTSFAAERTKRRRNR